MYFYHINHGINGFPDGEVEASDEGCADKRAVLVLRKQRFYRLWMGSRSNNVSLNFWIFRLWSRSQPRRPRQ